MILGIKNWERNMNIKMFGIYKYLIYVSSLMTITLYFENSHN